MWPPRFCCVSEGILGHGSKCAGRSLLEHMYKLEEGDHDWWWSHDPSELC